jgi:hypothetical protein
MTVSLRETGVEPKETLKMEAAKVKVNFPSTCGSGI